MGAGASANAVSQKINSASEAELRAMFQGLPQEQQASIEEALGELGLPAPTAPECDAQLDSSAKLGDAEGVKDAITAGAAVDGGLLYFGKTALMQAAAEGRHGVVETLQELGAKLEVEDSRGWTAFHFAAANGRIECLKSLSQLGANQTAMTKFKRNALDVVAGDLIFASKGDVSEEDPRLGVMKLLGELGLEHSAQFQLFVWAKEGNLDGMQVALDDGASVNLTDMQLATAVARAAEGGHPSCVRRLFESKADLNLADENGWAPVHYAAHKGDAECLKVLSELGADLKKETKFRRNALDLVEESILEDEDEDLGQDAAKFLKNAGLTTSCQWDLLRSAHLGECEFVKQALSNGAQIDFPDVRGLTAFVRAAITGQNDVLKILKDEGADIKKTDLRGWSAVHWACSMAEASALKVVHGMGVPLDARTKVNRNALDLCLEKMEHEMDEEETAARMEILGLFEAEKIEPSEQMRLWVYAKVGDHEQVTQALEDGADINLKNLDGKTAAQLASENGNKKVLKMLQSKGAVFEKA